MKYTVILIFKKGMKEVLLVEKNRGPYPGCLNGVGGKIESFDTSPFKGALREVKEETNINENDFELFNWLVTMNFPSSTELNVYYGILKEGVDFKQVEDEILNWYEVCNLTDVTNVKLAGEGNLPYLINAAIMEQK